MVRDNLNNSKINQQALLGKYLDERRSKKSVSDKIPKLEYREDIPLSFGQQRLWFLYKLDPENPVYNRSTVLRFNGSLNIISLEKSINQIIEQHEVLRTIFPETNGVPIQKIQPFKFINIPTDDVTNHPRQKRREIAEDRMVKIAHEPFRLETGPLIRSRLYQLDKNEFIFLFLTHHILFDAWSETIFINDLRNYYNSIETNLDLQLPSLSIQYCDFSHWQRQKVEQGIIRDQFDFWINQLKDYAPLEIPLDYPRPPIQTYHGSSISFTLSPENVRSLNKFCIEESITPFIFLLTAFKALLHWYTGQEDLVIGTPVAGRSHRDTENLIGVFINTIVIRSLIRGNLSFMQNLKGVRTTVLNAISNQEPPFELIIKEIQPERKQDKHPLFQVLFNYENIPQPSMDFNKLKVSRIEIPTRFSHYDLSLGINEYNYQIKCTFEFNTALFRVETIKLMVGHYQNIIKAALTFPDTKISELPILTELEKHKILFDWNDSEYKFPHYDSIQEFIEKQVEKNPESIAVISPSKGTSTEEDQILTYRELNQKANQLAHFLHKQGVHPDDLVGICLERSFELIVGILGILKAGCGYLPLDPKYPQERLTQMLKDSQPKFLLTQKSLFKKLYLDGLNSLCLDLDWAKLNQESRLNPISDNHAKNMAYAIYSSGSTGMPKGIVIEHESLINYILFRQTRFEISEGDRFLQFSPISFDLSIAEIFSSLISGATLVLRTEEMAHSPVLFFDICKRYQISHLKLTTPFWHLLTTIIKKPDFSFPESLRFISVAGDRLTVDDIIPWQQTRNNTTRLVNEYGPTETTGASTIYEFSINERFNFSPPIGRPNNNEQIYILDKHYSPVPIGVTGEMYIGGNGVGRGYLGHPKLTAEFFLPDPFSNKQGTRMYKTGDLARFLHDGNIEFIGRADHQVKIRGYRVELGEVEATLTSFDKVESAVVLLSEIPDGNKFLAAYVIASDKKGVTPRELQNHLQLKLPEFMVPTSYTILESFPLTPNGKINRHGFPPPDLSRPKLEIEVVKPRSILEKKLAEIWNEVLHLDEIGVWDNFFDLGGHSLMVTQVISRINQVSPVPITVREFFDGPTIADLAITIENKIDDYHNSPKPI